MNDRKPSRPFEKAAGVPRHDPGSVSGTGDARKAPPEVGGFARELLAADTAGVRGAAGPVVR